MPVKVSALDHIVINVSDVARSAQWYQNILGMEVRVFDPGPGKAPRTTLVFGNQKINVRPRGADKVEWFTADHETPGSDDLCFLTSATPDEVVAHLKAHEVAIEEGPVLKQGARGTLRSVYCRDPDGSLIEISSYEGVACPDASTGVILRCARRRNSAADFRASKDGPQAPSQSSFEARRRGEHLRMTGPK